MDATMSPSAASLYERLISLENVEDHFSLSLEKCSQLVAKMF